MRKVICQVILNKMTTFVLMLLSSVFWLECEKKKSILEMFQLFYLNFLTNIHSMSTAHKAMFSDFITLTKVVLD